MLQSPSRRPIKGFVTRGRGVTIHKADCVNLQATDSLRIVDVSWDEGESLTRVVRLGITAINRTGLLAQISKVFANNESDIVQVNIRTVNDDQEASGVFMISVKNVEHLTRIMNALEPERGGKGREDKHGLIEDDAHSTRTPSS